MTRSLNGVGTPHMVTKSKTRTPQSSSLARGDLRRGLIIPGRKPICSRSGHVLVTCPESYPRLSTETKATMATMATTETTRTRVERRECIYRRHVSISAFICVGYSWSNDRFYCSLFSETITCLPNDRSRDPRGSLRKHEYHGVFRSILERELPVNCVARRSHQQETENTTGRI